VGAGIKEGKKSKRAPETNEIRTAETPDGRDGKARNNEAERPESKRMLKRFDRVGPEPVVQRQPENPKPRNGAERIERPSRESIDRALQGSIGNGCQRGHRRNPDQK
jgi:hypothetical protein